MSSLKIVIESKDDEVFVDLSGFINEDSDFSSLKNLVGNKLIFDLDKITLINSCGIRDWIEFQKENLDFKHIVYKKCPQVIIEQMNIVAGFLHPQGVIESFYAPYYNEKTDTEVKILLTPQEVINKKAPLKCIDGTELEFDDIEAQYFNFIK
jgi:hypothetical protein